MRSEREQADELRGGLPRPRAGAPRSRSAERGGREPWSPDAARDPRGARDARSPREGRATGDRRSSGLTPGPEGRRAARRTPPPQRGLRGALGVLGMFVVTLAGAAVNSVVGVGLGTITTVALVVATIGAALVVRRRDLATVVVAPPLVYVGVAVVNIVLAPSATFSLPTIATLLIRGFPAMAIAVAVALVLTVVRLAARR